MHLFIFKEEKICIPIIIIINLHSLENEILDFIPFFFVSFDKRNKNLLCFVFSLFLFVSISFCSLASFAVAEAIISVLKVI